MVDPYLSTLHMAHTILLKLSTNCQYNDKDIIKSNIDNKNSYISHVEHTIAAFEFMHDFNLIS